MLRAAKAKIWIHANRNQCSPGIECNWFLGRLNVIKQMTKWPAATFARVFCFNHRVAVVVVVVAAVAVLLLLLFFLKGE